MLDQHDRAILRHVQDDNRLPIEKLADRVGLSPSAVQRRLAELRRKKVIQEDVAIVDPARAGRPVTLIVEVTVERERTDLIDAFCREMRAMPEVQQCYGITGAADFILIMTVEDMADYERFTRKVFYDNANIRRFESHVVMNRVKTGLYVPV